MVRSRRDAPNTRARRRSDVYAARNTEIRCERLTWRSRQAEDVVDHQGAIAGDVEQFTNHLLDANRTSAHADSVITTTRLGGGVFLIPATSPASDGLHCALWREIESGVQVTESAG